MSRIFSSRSGPTTFLKYCSKRIYDVTFSFAPLYPATSIAKSYPVNIYASLQHQGVTFQHCEGKSEYHSKGLVYNWSIIVPLCSVCLFTWFEYRHDLTEFSPKYVSTKRLLFSKAYCESVPTPSVTSKATDQKPLGSSGSAAPLHRLADEIKEGLPDYSLADVAYHNHPSKRVWVTYRQGVYDITEFIAKHPGGPQRIILAAGASIDPFWEMYSQHHTDQIYKILEEMRIGNLVLTPEEIENSKKEPLNTTSDAYQFEPLRHPALRVVSNKPFNAETPESLLGDTFITPNELFFVRNHLPVPKINVGTFRLEVSGLGVEGVINLTVEDIKTIFKQYEVTTTIQCAGNRRSAFSHHKPVKGLNWQSGAIGTATWKGAMLKDILHYCGVDSTKAKTLGIQHIIFEGCDQDLTSQPYGASIPVDKALNKDGDVLIAYEMNGKPLPLDHGFPLRAIVPGIVGARNVKWLERIIVSHEESPSFWQQNDYRVFSPSVDWDTVEWKRAPSIQEYPVQSGICQPLDGTVIFPDQDDITVKGYAWSGGGRAIIRVDVSIDGGKTWHEARLKRDSLKFNETEDEYEEDVDWNGKATDKAWAWVLWTAEIPLPANSRGEKVVVCCRAVDASYNTQPETPGPIWNLRGCLCNSWHKINLSIDESDSQ